MSLFETENGDVKAVNVVVAIAIIISVFVFLFMAISPIYRVYSAGQTGKAELAQAQANRQIKVIEAEAANLAATSQAEARIKIATAEATAEVERAKGVAKANEIIGNSLKGNEDYLRYLYISGLTGQPNQIIYVPTEAGLPILEAGKRK